MSHFLRFSFASLLLIVSGSALALPVSYTEITIYDGDSSAPTGWEGMQEDNETEPGTVHNQNWDLEAFISYGTNQIGMIGGYVFLNTNGGDRRPGDIFIDIDGDYVDGSTQTPGNGNQDIVDTYGYEYVLDVDWAAGTYSVFELVPGTTTTTTAYGINAGSNPWAFVSGGNLLGNGSFAYENGLTDEETGKLGGSHTAVTGFDLSFLGENVDFTTHFTPACGNDNLMGSATTVPVPAAVWLFGSALSLFGFRARRKRVKA
jgi:hypothetical protein